MSDNDSESRETVMDVVAVMRRGTRLKGFWSSLDLNEILAYHADHIEAAWKRDEERAVEHATRHAEAVARDNCRDCVHNPRGKNYEGGNGGNAAAVREALEKCREIALQWQADEAAGVAGATDKPQARSAAEAVIDMEFEINAAISKPPRNCDVGTPEEQGERCLAQFEQWRRKADGKKLITAIMEWAQMPYKAEEGGAS